MQFLFTTDDPGMTAAWQGFRKVCGNELVTRKRQPRTLDFASIGPAPLFKEMELTSFSDLRKLDLDVPVILCIKKYFLVSLKPESQAKKEVQPHVDARRRDRSGHPLRPPTPDRFLRDRCCVAGYFSFIVISARKESLWPAASRPRLLGLPRKPVRGESAPNRTEPNGAERNGTELTELSRTAESTATELSRTAESTATELSRTAESTATERSRTAESTATERSRTAESTATERSRTAESTATERSRTAESTAAHRVRNFCNKKFLPVADPFLEKVNIADLESPLHRAWVCARVCTCVCVCVCVCVGVARGRGNGTGGGGRGRDGDERGASTGVRARPREKIERAAGDGRRCWHAPRGGRPPRRRRRAGRPTSTLNNPRPAGAGPRGPPRPPRTLPPPPPPPPPRPPQSAPHH
ncbi:Protein of unknown function [Gryllus bimaculatus]|nr:Protein of unknown function [Gryllus bimaculatus]